MHPSPPSPSLPPSLLSQPTPWEDVQFQFSTKEEVDEGEGGGSRAAKLSKYIVESSTLSSSLSLSLLVWM
jgi:hypothetical protein